MSNTDPVEDPFAAGLVEICGRCYDIVESADQLFEANCAEKPELLIGAPIGQYHCPDCGAMVMAGLPHFTMCSRCIARKHPDFDKIDEEEKKAITK